MAAKNIVIIQGQTAEVDVQLIDGNTGNPFSLAGLTGATGVFPKADGTGMAVTGILKSSDLGTLSFSMDEDTTPNLNVGDAQNIEVRVDQGSLRSIAQLQGVLTVAAPTFTQFG